jgi:hypothetical protein
LPFFIVASPCSPQAVTRERERERVQETEAKGGRRRRYDRGKEGDTEIKAEEDEEVRGSFLRLLLAALLGWILSPATDGVTGVELALSPLDPSGEAGGAEKGPWR